MTNDVGQPIQARGQDTKIYHTAWQSIFFPIIINASGKHCVKCVE
jgi:hypothetical protein